MKFNIFLIIIYQLYCNNFLVSVANSQYNILRLLLSTNSPQHVYDSIDPNVVAKYDATAIKNWTIGNEFFYEFIFRFNKVNFTDYPIYNFFTIEHGFDKFYFKLFNEGNDVEIGFDDGSLNFHNVTFFRDRLWHNFMIIFSRTEGYAEVSFDCNPAKRIQFPKGSESEEEVRQIPLIIGFPKIPIYNVDIKKSILHDEIGNKCSLNCDEFSHKYSDQLNINNERATKVFTILPSKKSAEGSEQIKIGVQVSEVVPFRKSKTYETSKFAEPFPFDEVAKEPLTQLYLVEPTQDQHPVHSSLEESIFDSRVTSCAISKTTVKGQNVCKGQLIFEDRFDFINRSKWEQEVKIPLEADDAAFVSFQKYPENLYVKNGNLIIVPKLLSNLRGFNADRIRKGSLNLRSSCTGIVDARKECHRRTNHFQILPPIISAKIRTKSSFSFRYGVVEVRAKLPKGDWIFPQILLEPLLNDYGITGFRSGQMRIAFARGNEILFDQNLNDIGGSVLSGGVILSDDVTVWSNILRARKMPEHLGNKFHTYSLEWTDRYIRLSVDGQQYGEIEGGFNDNPQIPDSGFWKRGEYIAPFDKEFYLSFGVSVGGICDFPDDCLNWSWNRNDYLSKPWNNTSPKAELNFWRSRGDWLRTWNNNSKLEIDYVRVWAL